MRNNKKKYVLAAIVMVASIVVLSVYGTTVGFVYPKNSTDKMQETEKLEQGNISTKSENYEVLTGIDVEPNFFLVSADEILDTDRFEVRAFFSSGRSDILKSGVIFDDDNELIVMTEKGLAVTAGAITAQTGSVTIAYEGFKKKVDLRVYNNPANYIDSEGIVTNIGAYDVLVNKSRSLDKNYVPEELVTVEVPTLLGNPEVNKMRKKSADALKEMFDAANEQEGYELFARSGYRSYNTQNSLYRSYVDGHGQAQADKFSAKPGQSEHQTGLSMDISCAGVNYLLKESFGETPEGIWVAQNAHKYGFVIRYPKDKEEITGYIYEPWHIRYIGNDMAADVYEKGVTLEEYFNSFDEIGDLEIKN